MSFRTLRTARGFTLLELLVVISIMALATAGVSLALRDSGQTQLEREAARLAALLESAGPSRAGRAYPCAGAPTPRAFASTACPRTRFPPSGWTPA
ncbi:general secretion pathway protein H, partial [Acidovorax delafieldii 2AN]